MLPQQLVGSPRDCLKHRSSADHIGPEVGNGRRFQEHHQAVQYETGRIMLNSCFRKITSQSKLLKPCIRHRWGSSSRSGASPFVWFLHVLCFMKSSDSLTCKYCRTQRCLCLVAAWKRSLVICSPFPYLHPFWFGTERSPRMSGGSLKLRAQGRKSCPRPH